MEGSALLKLGAGATAVISIIGVLSIYNTAVTWVVHADDYHDNQEKLTATVLSLAETVAVLGTQAEMSEERRKILEERARMAQEAERQKLAALEAKATAKREVIDELCRSGVLPAASEQCRGH